MLKGKVLLIFHKWNKLEDNNEVNYLELDQVIEIGMRQYKQLNEKQKEIEIKRHGSVSRRVYYIYV